MNKVLSVLLTYLPSRKIRSEGNYLLQLHLYLNLYQYGWEFKKKEEETNKKKSPPQTCRQHLVKPILAEPSFSRGELTRADKKYIIIDRCLARADNEIAVEQGELHLFCCRKTSCVQSACSQLISNALY